MFILDGDGDANTEESLVLLLLLLYPLDIETHCVSGVVLFSPVSVLYISSFAVFSLLVIRISLVSPLTVICISLVFSLTLICVSLMISFSSLLTKLSRIDDSSSVDGVEDPLFVIDGFRVAVEVTSSDVLIDNMGGDGTLMAFILFVDKVVPTPLFPCWQSLMCFCVSSRVL